MNSSLHICILKVYNCKTNGKHSLNVYNILVTSIDDTFTLKLIFKRMNIFLCTYKIKDENETNKSLS